jgi:hypothetical protein
VFLSLDPDTVDYFERRIRYLALYSPLAICLTLSFLPAFLPGRTPAARRAPAGLWALSLALSGALWLWLSKIVIVDAAATDNLTELIATSGPLHLTGAPFLIMVAVVIAAHAALVVHSRTASQLMMALAASVVAIPAGWWLLGLGLEQHVTRYGGSFPAIQFLLGPDRRNALSPLTLFVRWAFLQTGAVLVIAAGAWIAGQAARRVRRTPRAAIDTAVRAAAPSSEFQGTLSP